MKIVTDRGADFGPDQLAGLQIHFAPMRLVLDGKTYSSGVDITPENFYELMAAPLRLPQEILPKFTASWRKRMRTSSRFTSLLD